VLLGARYAPCMRRDERLFDLIEEDRVEERSSGCCIRNSDFGCVQVNSASDCTVSTPCASYTITLLEHTLGNISILF